MKPTLKRSSNRKARNNALILPIILVAALIIETCLLIYTAFSADKASKNAENYKFRFESLHNQHNSLLLEKSTLKMQNLTLADENKELREALTLASQRLAFQDNEQQERFGSLRKSSAEEPERCENAAVTWSIDRLPEGKTNTYRCMDFRTITDKSSGQYMLQNEDFTFTEDNTGLRFSIIDGEKYYHAALATAYGIDIGNTWRVTLDTGYTFNVIHAEYKHDIKHPRADDFGDPDVNYAGNQTTSVIEFVNDMTVMPRELRGLGGMFSEDFGGKAGVLGNIVKMDPTGRKWRNG